MAASSQTNASTIPQGFSIYQPALGAQLQFLPAIGTPQLDELINAYVAGPASTQEKRATVSLDFLEYAHLTGQTFKFYPVYSVNAAVDSPATDSGYGSSFNVSPVTSAWDFSRISTSSRSPTSQSHKSPKTVSSRHQTTDFSNLPGMKIMTKDGRDVTNSASRGSKTKEQRDHAHLMRIIKACDSCKRKKIRCDPSHKKRSATQSQSQAQAAVKSTKKAKAVAEAVAFAIPVVDTPVQAPPIAMDECFAPIDMDALTPSLPMLEPWEEFIEYPPANDYDFFYDPEGYFSPGSSSGSAYSTKPVTPTSQQDASVMYGLPSAEVTVASPQLPFNQTESSQTYADFNLFSPESNFSEDDQMVPIELSRHLSNQSYSQQSNSLRSDQDTGGLDVESSLIQNVSDPASWPLSSRRSGKDDCVTYRDPGSSGGDTYSPSSSSMSSDMLSLSTNSIAEPLSQFTDIIEPCYSSGYDGIHNRTQALTDAPIIEGVSTLAELSRKLSTLAELRQPDAPYTQPGGQQTMTNSVNATSASQSSQTRSRAELDPFDYKDALISDTGVTPIAKAANTDIDVLTPAPESPAMASENATSEPSISTTSVADATIAANLFGSSISNMLMTRDARSYSSNLRALNSVVAPHHTESREELANLEESRIRHGTIASEAGIAGIGVDHHDHSHTNAQSTNVELARNSDGKYIPTDVKPQTVQQVLPESSIIAPTAESRSLDSKYAPMVAAESVAAGTMLQAIVAMSIIASGSAKSYVELCLATAMAVMMAFVACATSLHNSSKVNTYSGKSRYFENGMAPPKAVLRDQIETFKSQVSNGTKSVTKFMSSISTMSQGMGLMV